MPYVLPSSKVAVFFSPKSGGTSLRAYMFHLENGFPFQNYSVQGQSIDANDIVKNTRWRAIDQDALNGFQKFAIVRDPVKRFLSGYSNRIGHYRELSEAHSGEKLRKLNLPPDPTIESFIDRFHEYKHVDWQVRRHFWLQQSFLGKDPKYYEKTYKLENIGELVSDFNARFGIEGVMPRLQTGGKKLQFDELPEETQGKLLELVADDVAFKMHPEYKRPYNL